MMAGLDLDAGLVGRVAAGSEPTDGGVNPEQARSDGDRQRGVTVTARIRLEACRVGTR